MSQFTLIWTVVTNVNTIGQRASYRYRLTGGAFDSAGFTPNNDLSPSTTTVDSPVLGENKVIQFKISTLCTSGGPTDNDNGLQEVIEFAEIVPTIGKTENSSNISINISGTDITKARFTLRKSSDNTSVGTANVVNKSGNTISDSRIGLTSSTNYYWQIELYATVKTTEVKSSDIDYVGVPFSPYPFTTDAPSICPTVTNITSVSSIEIL